MLDISIERWSGLKKVFSLLSPVYV